MSYHCSSSPMEDHKTEHLWSERFQDLASWCHQPQDELNTPNVSNQNEFNFSFDEQSMYYPWEANSSSVDLKGDDMWKPLADPLYYQFSPEEDNNNLPTQTLMDDKGYNETGIRYSGNLLLTQYPCTDLDQERDSCQTDMKSTAWELSQKQLITNSKPQCTTSIDQRQENLMKTTQPTGILPITNKPRPLLKLNIAAANKEPISSVDIAAPISMNTPDVFKSLSEDSNFNLINFVCENYEDQNMIAVNPSSIVSQRPKEIQSVSQQIIKIDHDYAESLPHEEQLSCGPFLVSRDEEPLSFIKEEDEAKSSMPIAIKDEPSSPIPSCSSLGKRVRKSTNSNDFVFDDDPHSDESSDWSPTAKKKCKSTKRKVSCSKQIGKRTRTSSISDSGSVTSGPDRYRELRDRNNEASRRSRQNRKQREVEMLQKLSSLQRENTQFKARAASLEKRVKSLRNILLKVVLEKKK